MRSFVVTTKLNLASKPFSNHALPWVVTSLVTLVSLIAFVFIIRWTGQTRAQADAVQADINVLSQQEQALRVKAQEVKNSLSTEQQQTLAAAHVLVDRKGFSWSRLFSDLESALPGSVRVTRISVRDVAARGDQTLAELDLTAVTKTPSTITDMIAEMDRVGIFRAELRSQNLQKGRGESGTEYELSVIYRPRAGVASDDNRVDLASAGTSVAVSTGGSK
jgi:Tfp pilus assembly protein PilN